MLAYRVGSREKSISVAPVRTLPLSQDRRRVILEQTENELSTVKNPEEKKLLSLKHDRRNVYGENAKASRKGVPRSKQLGNKSVRAAAAQVLANKRGASADLELDAAEALAKSRLVRSERSRFKKTPDAPLFKVLLARKNGKPKFNSDCEPDMSLELINRARRGLRGQKKT